MALSLLGMTNLWDGLQTGGALTSAEAKWSPARMIMNGLVAALTSS